MSGWEGEGLGGSGRGGGGGWRAVGSRWVGAGHTGSRHTALPDLPARGSRPSVQGLMGTSSHKHGRLNPWPLVTGRASRSGRWGWKFQSSNHVVGSLGNQTPSLGYHLGTFQSHLKGMVTNKHSFNSLPLVLELFQGSDDRSPNATGLTLMDSKGFSLALGQKQG